MKWIVAAAALGLASTAHADFSSYPQPLADALERTYDASDSAVWHFTMEVTIEGEQMRVRFDGTQPDGADWALLFPDHPDDLSAPLADIWTDMNTPDDGEEDDNSGSVSIGAGGLFFDTDTAAIIAGDVVQAPSEARGLRYDFRPDLNPGEEDNDVMEDHLAGQVDVSPAGHVSRIRIFAPESFKPNPAARVHTFEMHMEFEQIEDLPAPIMTLMSTDVEVSALFQRQSQSIQFRFSDVEYTAP